MITQADRAAAITGFEPVDIMEGIWMILSQIESGKKEIAIQYSRGVRPEGNIRAMNFLKSMFQMATVEWRGLGPIPASGLVFNNTYAAFDALKKFDIPEIHSVEIKGYGCGDKSSAGLPLI